MTCHSITGAVYQDLFLDFMDLGHLDSNSFVATDCFTYRPSIYTEGLDDVDGCFSYYGDDNSFSLYFKRYPLRRAYYIVEDGIVPNYPIFRDVLEDCLESLGIDARIKGRCARELYQEYRLADMVTALKEYNEVFSMLEEVDRDSLDDTLLEDKRPLTRALIKGKYPTDVVKFAIDCIKDGW